MPIRRHNQIANVRSADNLARLAANAVIVVADLEPLRPSPRSHIDGGGLAAVGWQRQERPNQHQWCRRHHELFAWRDGLAIIHRGDFRRGGQFFSDSSDEPIATNAMVAIRCRPLTAGSLRRLERHARFWLRTKIPTQQRSVSVNAHSRLPHPIPWSFRCVSRLCVKCGRFVVPASS